MASIAMIQNGKRQAKPSSHLETGLQSVVDRIAESDCPVLIMGEHGAGKRSMARQIHAQSSLSRYEFKEIRCVDANAQMLRDALSTNGTVYLSEITELVLPLQELIVNEHFRSVQTRACRLLCSSSRELLEEVKSWRMREDFYYLVSAVSLRIPPLRCRKSEILSIADELLTQFSKQFDRPKPVLCKEIIEHLMEHTWPDNLPELETAIKTFVAIGDQAISLAAIKAATSGRTNGNRKLPFLKEATRASAIQIERQLISEVLVLTGGNRKRAAVELGISYKALLNKLKQIETENQSRFCKNGVA
jgi:DNA-binding NtrC family response regulator